MPDSRYYMDVYGVTGETEETQYVSVFFPELGTVTVTYEIRPFANEETPRPVISVDFPIEKIDVIDRNGHDRQIS